MRELVATIRPARPDDAGELTALCRASKRHWGYPESWLVQWSAELTITAEQMRENPTFCAVESDRIVGFATVRFALPEAWLEHLWIRPEAMNRGLGRRLFECAEEVARTAGALRLGIVGDPHAEGFYRRMGAVIVGRQDASMDGSPRTLPRLEKRL